MWAVIVVDTENGHVDSFRAFNGHPIAVSYYMDFVEKLRGNSLEPVLKLEDFMEESNIHVTIGRGDDSALVVSLVQGPMGFENLMDTEVSSALRL